MRLRALLALLAVAITALVLGACTSDSGGGDAPTATPAPTSTPESAVRTVTSDDGKLKLEIPPGAVADDVEITITAVPKAELPEAFRDLRGLGTGYRMEPDGLEFSAPAMATLVLARADLELETGGGITAYALVSFRTGGELELLPEQSTEWTVGAETVRVRGQLSHFSWIGRTQGSLHVEIEKADPQQPLGGTFTVKATATNTDSTGRVLLRSTNGEFRHEKNFISVVGERSFPFSPQNLTQGEKIEGTATYSCDEVGDDVYFVRVFASSVLSIDPEGDVLSLLTVIVGSAVECTSALDAPTPAPMLDLGCFHRDTDSDVIVKISGLQPGETVSGTVTRRGGGGVVGDGTFTATGGDDGTAMATITITSFGTYTATLDGGGASATKRVEGEPGECDDDDD